MGFQVAPVVRNLPASAGDANRLGFNPKVGRSPGGEHGNPLQYSCLENRHERIQSMQSQRVRQCS